jgi:hypothetical protein
MLARAEADDTHAVCKELTQISSIPNDKLQNLEFEIWSLRLSA